MLNLKSIFDTIVSAASDLGDVLTSLGSIETTIGPVVLDVTGPTVVTVSSAGTAVPLSATTLHVSGLEVTAKLTNTGKIYIGGSSVDKTSAAAVPLGAGDVWGKGPDFGFIYDLNKIYIDADTDSEGVLVTYYAEILT